MKNKFSTKKKLVVVSAGIILLSNLSGCSCNANIVKEETTTTSPEITIESVESSLDTVSQIETSESAVDTNIGSYFDVETVSYTNPFISSDISTDDYNYICSQVMSGPDWMLMYGFDNEYTNNILRETIYNYSGEYNDSATLSDVGYFQGLSYMSNVVSQSKYSEVFSEGQFGPYMLAYVRAVLIDQNLRFGIDEIPYSYIEERFPAIVNSIMETGDFPMGWQDDNDVDYEYMTNPIDYNNAYDYELMMFTAITMYNNTRLSYIYNNPYGDPAEFDEIRQVRDSETGRNVLVPTEEQYYQMMEDINSVQFCENMNIMYVESEEDFYNCYGVTVQEIVSDSWISEINQNYQRGQG